MKLFRQFVRQRSTLYRLIYAFRVEKSVAFGAGFGVATAITLLIVRGFVYWVSIRPAGLDETAIKAVSSKASQTFIVSGENKEITPSGFELSFVLANTTNHDYTLREGVKLFKRDAQTGALSELKGKLVHDFLVPAKDKAEVTIQIEYSCGI